ncbi:MAG: hypothetical protein NTNFB02_00620 [Nitrospira sp.]
MTTVTGEELRQRLQGIAQGPWSKGVHDAHRMLAPTAQLRGRLYRSPTIKLNKLELTDFDTKKNADFMTIFRPHFLDRNGVTDPAEIEAREILDNALILPELYELAVQTGYLPVEQVKEPAREILGDLLWSEAVRGFVQSYDYIAVQMLATRVGMTGFGVIHPPAPKKDAALRFAGFLAHLRAFYADDQIFTWTHFMDDYIEEPEEQEKLCSYLRGESNTAPKRFGELLAGCQFFSASLASAFHVLDQEELGRFGLIHAYWLQKFFGYKMDKEGYVKDVRVWGSTDSWAHLFRESSHLIPESIGSEISGVVRQQFCEQVQLLKETFDAVIAMTKPILKKGNVSGEDGTRRLVRSVKKRKGRKRTGKR